MTLRIYNILAQLVAVPILQGSGEHLENVLLVWNGTGDYTAYWDGMILNTGREAASGNSRRVCLSGRNAPDWRRWRARVLLLKR